MRYFDKKILNMIIIISLSIATFMWTFFIFHEKPVWHFIVTVIVIRILASFTIYKDYSLSWSKASQKTFLLKSLVYVSAFVVYAPIFYGKVTLALMVSELLLYLFCINFAMYLYYFLVNRSKVEKTKDVVIYGAGRAGLQLESEFANSEYKIRYFVDDDKVLQNRSIDSIAVISKDKLQERLATTKFDLLVIAMPSASKERVIQIYDMLESYFKEIKILPGLDKILNDTNFTKQLKNISLEDLLARNPKDLDKEKIASFIQNKIVLITGAGGSIGSEISRQCIKYGAKQLILVDNSEYNLYTIAEELAGAPIVTVMKNIVDEKQLQKSFERYKPDIVIHAAAYKHVPLVEENITEAIVNNVAGTKGVIDLSIKYGVEKFVLISTDKAVRPTNVMGATKRICELYAQNVLPVNDAGKTEIVAVRFGNVLGSSGSVIPKFKKQIKAGGPITVTHPEITRYFMLIPEACELVLQAGAIGNGGEIFILDMGKPIKIVDLAKKMCELSGQDDIEIQFTGLRPGEKLYEELLLDASDATTEYESITVASKTDYDLQKLNKDILELLISDDKLRKLKEIVPEFNHKP